MTYHPNDPNLDRDRNPTVFERDTDSSAMWGLGAVAALVLLGLVVWSFSGAPTNTATTTSPDPNTGSVTRTEPRPPQPPIENKTVTPPAATPAPATPPAPTPAVPASPPAQQ